MKPTIDNFIKFNPRVGSDSIQIIGYPGSGKTVHGISIATRCIRNGEMGLTHGDLMCEWRHFDNYNIPITLIVPEGLDIETHGDILPKFQKDQWIRRDYKTLDVTEFLTPGELVVVYDDCMDSTSKTNLWTKIAKSLVLRNTHVDKPVCYLNNEAGITYPELAGKDQWRYLDEFAEYFVYFRKAFVRAILLSQLETEIYHRIRGKCIWKIFRIAVPGKHSIGRPVRKYARRMRRDNYHIFYGELFTPLNLNPKINEIKSIWKFLPSDLINLNGEEGIHPSSTKNELLSKALNNLYENFSSDRQLAELTGLDFRTVQKYRKVTVYTNGDN